MDTIWYSGLTCSNFISQEDKLTTYSNLHKQLVNENTSILLTLTFYKTIEDMTHQSASHVAVLCRQKNMEYQFLPTQPNLEGDYWNL